MELNIINKKTIPKLLASTIFALPLKRGNVSREALSAIVSTEKIIRKNN